MGIAALASVGLSFYLGNMVGSKLAQMGYREKLLNWKEGIVSRMNKTKTVKTNPNAQVLKVGDVTIISPGNGASQEEQSAFVKAIEKTAVKTEKVTVSTACSMEPKVIRMTSGSNITFFNADSVPHTLKIGANKKDMVIESGSSQESVFGAELVGIHGVVCDSTNTHVGFLQVTDK